MGNFIKNMKLRVKLVSAFGLIALLLLVVSLVSIINLRKMENNIDMIDTKVITQLDNLNKASNALSKAKLEARSVLLDKPHDEKISNMRKTVEYVESMAEIMEGYRENIISDDAKRVYENYLKKYEEYIKGLKDFAETVYSSREDDAEYTKGQIESLSPLSQECLDMLDELASLKVDKGEELSNRVVADSKVTTFRLIFIAVIGFAASLSLGIYFAISISTPILKGVELVKKSAAGDFTVKVPDTYGAEIGELFEAYNTLTEFNVTQVSDLKSTIETIRKSAQAMMMVSTNMAENSKGLGEQTSMVSTSAEEFSAGMTQSSNSLSTASAHISAVASSIEEINSTIGTVAAASEQTSTRVMQSSSLVESIQESIKNSSESVVVVSKAFDNVASSIDEINRSIAVVSEHCTVTVKRMSDADTKAKNTNEIIRRLEVANKQIGKIVNVINDIADQTNMLALNAAIEAAGAGEAGKGFMVVANEVKELAKQTAEATDEIAAQIENMQNNMTDAVSAVSEITSIINSMSEFISSLTTEISGQGRRSDRIAEDSADAAQRMNELKAEITRISDNALSVTRTVADSAQGVNEIAKSTAELVIGTQEIAMNSERASNNMSEINRAIKEMAIGLVDISKNINLINKEAGDVQASADSTEKSSRELLTIANDMEQLISNYKIS